MEPRSSGFRINSGLLEKGKWADLLILGNDPLEDIGHIRDIEFVVRAGEIHNRADFAVEN